jgi:hypothetical protein
VPLLVLRILGPQLLGLLAYFLLRRRAMLAQASAVAATALAAVVAGLVLPLPRLGAFVAIEVFAALLAQLIIAGANEVD